jgi:hypothetical protein
VGVSSESGQVTLGVRRAKEGGGRGKDGAPRVFTYDAAYDEGASQAAVYADLAAPLVPTFLAGFNATVFAYGQTGSGKTHTMGSSASAAAAAGGDTEWGVIPRVARDILEAKEAFLAADAGSEGGGMEVEEGGGGSGSGSGGAPSPPPHRLTASFIEIYCEKIRDLLAPIAREEVGADDGEEGAGGGGGSGAPAAPAGSSAASHPPRTDRFGNVMPDGVTEREVASLDDVYALLAEGAERRVTEKTRMNAVSSRR